MSSLSRYVVPCITEGVAVISDYRDGPPTVCPNNNTHIINQEGIYLYHTIIPKTVTINQDSNVETGGHYRADQFELQITGITGATASYDISYPYNIGVYSVTFLVSPDNVGDSYDVISYPDTPSGSIINPVTIGASSLILSSVSMLNPGFYISITDGVNTNDLGFITSIDKITGVVNFSNPSMNEFISGSIVLISIPRIKNGKFVNAEDISLGFSKIGSAGLPAGRIVRFRYVNSTGSPKTLNFIVELQF